MALATTVKMNTHTTDDAQTLRHALALYEQGAFFACHDALEILWQRERTALLAEAEPYFAVPDASPAAFTADRLPKIRRRPEPAGTPS
jgi:hypothetical protein